MQLQITAHRVCGVCLLVWESQRNKGPCCVIFYIFTKLPLNSLVLKPVNWYCCCFAKWWCQSAFRWSSGCSWSSLLTASCPCQHLTSAVRSGVSLRAVAYTQIVPWKRLKMQSVKKTLHRRISIPVWKLTRDVLTPNFPSPFPFPNLVCSQYQVLTWHHSKKIAIPLKREV